jgi:hypothetical protein
VLTQGEIEDAIMATTDRIEEMIGEYATSCDNAADAEATYRVRFARAFLTFKGSRTDEGKLMTEKECEARATVMVENDLRSYKLSAAVVDSGKQAQLSQRARLDALRTLSANVRAAT